MTVIKRDKTRREGGQTMILIIILFLAFSLTAIFGVVNPVIRHARATANILQSKQGYYLAESGVEDIIYRLRNGKQTSSLNALTLNGELVETSITDTLSGKNITAEGDSQNFIRKVEVNLVAGIGVAFNYGVQSGTGGFAMSNNAGVNGNVYSNGPISGANGAFISGSAISSNSASFDISVENSAPATPSNSITFGHSSGSQDLAQSFSVGEAGPIGKVSLYLKKVSTPSNINVKIVADNAGLPSATVLSSATLSASLITTNYGWVELPMPASSDLLVGSSYWVVLDTSTNSSRYYMLGANDTYLAGQAKIGGFGGSWNNTSPAGLDGYFKIYLGGLTGSINNVSIGSSGTGMARAHAVNDVSVTGSLYCQTGSGNNKSCDTSQADPSPLPFPISDGNIAQWQNKAESGTILIGDQLLDGGASNLGPAKIIGNLTLDNNHLLTITGTVWVTGNITINNASKIKLDSAYGVSSGSIVADGRVVIANGSSFAGSGQSNSYIMVLTTSNCPDSSSCSGNSAILVGNNARAVILNAQKGTIRFSNNAAAKESTANLISLQNNAIITYESGLANVNFTSGPGGGYDIIKWLEIE